MPAGPFVQIEIDNAASEQFTVLRIETEDSSGFLYELTNALAFSGVYISRVQVQSDGNRVFDSLLVTDGIELEAPKTRLLVNQLKQWGLEKVLIIVEAQDEKLYLAARNLPFVEVLEVAGVNPLALAGYDKVLVTRGAVKMLEERLQ